MRTWAATLLIVGAMAGVPARSLKAAGRPHVLTAVRSPCSLRVVCQELSRRYGCRVTPDGALAELRVTWAFDRPAPIDTVLARIGVLTDSRVVKRRSESGSVDYRLERRPETLRLEAAWKREGVLRTIRSAIAAARRYEAGDEDLSGVGDGIRTYLKMGRAAEAKLLLRLSGDQLDRLVAAEEVRFPAEALRDVDLERLVEGRFRSRPYDDETEADARRFMEREIQSTRERGIGFQIEFSRKGARFHLMLWFGPPHRSGDVVCWFDTDELGLPLTRTNPYRLLETGAAGAPQPDLPANFEQPIGGDVAVPADARWEVALRELGRVAGVDVPSDGYLARGESKLHSRGHDRRTLVPRGTKLADAMDRLCREFGYLWWEHGGCVYFRARAWVWDQDYEVSETLLDRWNAALATRHALGPGEVELLTALTPRQINGLGNLGGSNGVMRTLDEPGGPEFLTLFHACSALQRMQILGRGLVVTPEQAAGLDHLVYPMRAGAAPHPVLLRLGQGVRRDDASDPPLLNVTFRLVRGEGETQFAEEFSVALPQFPHPFEPD